MGLLCVETPVQAGKSALVPVSETQSPFFSVHLKADFLDVPAWSKAELGNVGKVLNKMPVAACHFRKTSKLSMVS